MPDPTETCFIAMPITTHPDEEARYGDSDHWTHVMDHLFVPAIEAAGYSALRPVSKGSSMIHADIVKNLEQADMVLCDLSGLNANVFFELGVRTSLDRPIAIVRDDGTRIPFDLSGMNAHTYEAGLRPWDLGAQIATLTEHLRDSRAACNGGNPLWRQFGLTLRAMESNPSESPLEAKLDLLTTRIPQLEAELAEARNREENQMLTLRHTDHELAQRFPASTNFYTGSRADGDTGLAAEAIKRSLKKEGTAASVEVREDVVRVSVQANPKEDVLKRMQLLADRYIVPVEVVLETENKLIYLARWLPPFR